MRPRPRRRDGPLRPRAALNVDGARAKAGTNGLIAVAFYDAAAKRGRLLVGYVGEDGIEADTWYRAKDGKLIKDLDQT